MWGNAEKNAWLNEALPIAREQWAALEWLYLLPVGHPVLDRTQRRQSFEALLRALRSEVDKAVILRAEFGGNSEKKNTAQPPGPPNWLPIVEQIYGPRDDYPSSFADLTVTMQQAIRQKIKETAIS